MSLAETQLVLRHNLDFYNPAIASRDLDPVGAAPITSLSSRWSFDDTVRSFCSPREIEEEVLVLNNFLPSCFRRQSLGRAGHNRDSAKPLRA